MVRKGERIDLGEVVNSAVEEGVEGIIEGRPRFSGQEEFLLQHIDKKKIKTYATNIGKQLQNYKDPKKAEKAIGKFYKDLAGYVASGELLDEKGKEIVLRASWERKARSWFGGGEAKEVLRGEKYLDKVMGSFRDIYRLLKNPDYAQRMPELAKAAATVNDMGFIDAVVNVLYKDGLMDKHKYIFFKKAIRKRAEEGAEYTQQKIQDYIMPQKAAAAILGVLGLATILTTSKITGGAIGASKSDLFGLIAGVLLLVSGIWTWFKKMKQN